MGSVLQQRTKLIHSEVDSERERENEIRLRNNSAKQFEKKNE